MDIVTNNPINTSLNEVSNLSSSVNLHALEQTRNITNSDEGSFSINLTNNTKRSDLSTTLKNFTQEIASRQFIADNLHKQTNLLNELQTTTNKIVDAQNPQEMSDQLQPSIEANINQYNEMVAQIDLTQEDTVPSRAYFDGKVGAKPLSPSEILQAVEKQMSLVKEQQHSNNQQLDQVKTEALKTINTQIEQTKAASPFKEIDFAQDIGNFSSANINNVLGSVAVSQANAIPANSPRLLA